MTRVLEGWPYMLPVQGLGPSRWEHFHGAEPVSPDRGLLAARRPSVQVTCQVVAPRVVLSLEP